MAAFSSLFLISLSLLQFFLGTYSATLTIKNNCNDNIWPAVSSNPGSPLLSPSGFFLNPGDSETLPVPTSWSGRLWARTQCTTSATGKFSCATGDCGSSAVDCGGDDGKFSPPATVAELTINSPSEADTFSVSVVDGYNLPVTVVPTGAARSCATVGCAVDINKANPPAELRVSSGGGNETVGLKSGCEAVGEADYCCGNSNGSYSSSKITTCKPNSYSELFKNWCPQARTFAYDTTGTTFTCEAENYVVNFCSSYSGLPTGTGTTIPEAQGSDSNNYDEKSTDSKFGIIIGVIVGVVGIVLIFWFWRWCIESDCESDCELGECSCTCCSIFSCSLCFDNNC